MESAIVIRRFDSNGRKETLANGEILINLEIVAEG